MELKYKGDDLIKFTKTLADLHRAALPNAVRFSLNEMAFDVKKNQLQKAADKQFTIRNKTFFKRFSGVEKATGYNVNKMTSIVGMLNDEKSGAARLGEQEKGGTVNNNVIVLDGGRTSKSTKKKIANKYRGLAKKKTIKTNKKRYAYNAVRAKKQDKLLDYRKGSKSYLIEVQKVLRRKKGIWFKTNLLAVKQENNKIKLKKAPFLQKAGEQTAKKANSIFRKEATKQIQKWTKK